MVLNERQTLWLRKCSVVQYAISWSFVGMRDGAMIYFEDSKPSCPLSRVTGDYCLLCIVASSLVRLCGQ